MWEKNLTLKTFAWAFVLQAERHYFPPLQKPTKSPSQPSEIHTFYQNVALCKLHRKKTPIIIFICRGFPNQINQKLIYRYEYIVNNFYYFWLNKNRSLRMGIVRN